MAAASNRRDYQNVPSADLEDDDDLIDPDDGTAAPFTAVFKLGYY